MESNINESGTQTLKSENALKKRVLFIITQGELGGAQQFLARFLNQLDKDKFEYAVVMGTDGHKEITNSLPGGIKIYHPQRFQRNPNPINDLLSLWELKNIILDFKPDILFLNSSKAGFNGSWAAKMTCKQLPNLKVVYRIGGWTFNDPWPAWKKLAFRLAERLSARWKDYIIVNNNYDLELAQQYHIKPRQEVLLIHNGIDPYLSFLPKEEARLKLFEKISPLPGGHMFMQTDTVIGTIANFYPAKDVANLIRAVALTKSDALFVIIGDGILRSEIEREIETLKLGHRVFILGKLPEAHKYLPAFDMFVLPSNKEGFPWSMLEAIAAKIPVVATKVGAIPEIIENDRSGFVVAPRDPQSLATAIDNLSSDERMRQEFAIQAHQTLLKHFTLNQMVEKYEKLFSGL